jgi:hypothetical protein
MAVLSIHIDRRRHSREGLMAQLEDITYAALRRCCADVLDKISPALDIHAEVGNANVVSAPSLMALSEKPSIA